MRNDHDALIAIAAGLPAVHRARIRQRFERMQRAELTRITRGWIVAYVLIGAAIFGALAAV